VAPWVARLAGMLLALAGVAAGWTILRFSDSRLTARLLFYTIAGSIALVAVLIGSQLALAPPGTVPRLPKWALAVGGTLLIGVGLAQIVLWVVEPRAGGGALLGIALAAAGVGAWRLALRARRVLPVRQDGA